MIKHKFKLLMKGVVFNNPVSFSNISERFRNIQISTAADGSLELIVEKQETRSIEISTKEAKIEANELVDRLSILDNHYVESFNYLGYLNSSNEFVRGEKISGTLEILIGIIQDPKEYYSQEYVKAIINSKKNSVILRTYRTALGIRDKISQYLVFYGILLILKGEKQSEVDKYIIKEIPDILIVIGKLGDETIITNIRNMIAHPGKDLDMINLNIKVNDYLEELKKLVLGLLRAN